ncbi:nitrous oxide reductase accessory protein NosL [Natrialbaceae archaeon GCM10025810]|uniref:nitrous oxide reductase accessory protein NosL n=1 Tax=Halovalidus salilacus TaxID=3075124 RepID=UPI00361162CA
MSRNRCPSSERRPAGRGSEPTRRRVLFGAGVAATAALAGCLGEADDGQADDPADPIDLSDGQECDVCGMVITELYGPAGQIFYADGEPEGRDGPARFDSVAELLAYREEREARGWEERAVFVTDYSSVEYDLVEGDEALHATTHAEADDFADATDCQFVVDSEVKGAMGDDHFPFSDPADAEAFADEHGGEVLEWAELSAADAGRD